MKSVNRIALLRKRQKLLRELDSIHTVLAASGMAAEENNKKRASRFANMSPGRAVRKYLVEEDQPRSLSAIVRALIEGGATVGQKHAEQNIRRAIEVNVELGLLVENAGTISLPEWHGSPFTQSPQVQDDRVKTVLQRMHLDLDAPLSIGELAESVQLSPSRLSHLFRSELEMSPAQYLKRIRIYVAGNMLRHTYLSQKEILAAIGIPDRSHFTRHFKRIYGQSPTQFRMTATRARTATKFPPNSVLG